MECAPDLRGAVLEDRLQSHVSLHVRTLHLGVLRLAIHRRLGADRRQAVRPRARGQCPRDDERCQKGEAATVPGLGRAGGPVPRCDWRLLARGRARVRGGAPDVDPQRLHHARVQPARQVPGDEIAPRPTPASPAAGGLRVLHISPQRRLLLRPRSRYGCTTRPRRRGRPSRSTTRSRARWAPPTRCT